MSEWKRENREQGKRGLNLGGIDQNCLWIPLQSIIKEEHPIVGWHQHLILQKQLFIGGLKREDYWINSMTKKTIPLSPYLKAGACGNRFLGHDRTWRKLGAEVLWVRSSPNRWLSAILRLGFLRHFPIPELHAFGIKPSTPELPALVLGRGEEAVPCLNIQTFKRLTVKMSGR